MSIIKILFFSLALVSFSGVFGQAAKPAFYDDIVAFKKQDSIAPPPKNAILFIGSSSFTKWKNVQNMFPAYTIINRGFGGSSLPDVTRYANTIIFPYQPKQIVIYCGENDVASGLDSKQVSDRFKTLFLLIRERLPAIPVIFISMKPSPSREKFAPVLVQANQIIKNFLWTQGNCIYVDVYKLMLDSNGKARPALFVEDMLHMNPDGYKIWQEALLPYLKK
jgi:lysophospholipase L1-like esterase